MKAIDPNRMIDYIPKEDRDKAKDEQTIFSVKFLTSGSNATLRDETYDVVGTGKQRKEMLKTGTTELKSLKLGLKGWSNFVDNDGEPVPFDGENIDKMIDMIPPIVRTEISDFIRGESTLDDSD